ncbi:S46 family peptidase [Puteibacter caeruleilacunae]|nr:S46 family peptidase [Puteibacter caeruleilacunae]
MIKGIIRLLIICILSGQAALANEGMWLPTLLKKYNIEEMQKMGFKLTAEDIYSVNQASLKDAIVLFGRGCTGELISDKGLLITNHHCGYRYIQQHSSVENDYLTNGFWAMSQQEELINPGLSVKFLKRMEDVTDRVITWKDTIPDRIEQEKIIDENIEAIEREAVENGKYVADVKPLFYGNQYFLYIYEEYKDVRLVGAPPSAIGKFGGDTDNWMWPRHTGDFSLFRIYTDKDGNPASYSPDNVPMKSKKFLPISLKGAQENDFTLVFGYPGSTQEYLPSIAVDQIINQNDPDKVAIRDLKLAILGASMKSDPAIRIQYASKYAGTSNSWKKWQGEIMGLKRLKAVERKKEFESDFTSWVNQSETRKKSYGDILESFKGLYEQLAPYSKANDYYSEIVYRGTDALQLVAKTNPVLRLFGSMDDKQIEKSQKALTVLSTSHFKDYHKPTDRKVFIALFNKYINDLPKEFVPVKLSKLKKEKRDKYLLKIYDKSVFTDQQKYSDLVSTFNEKAKEIFQNDPLFKLYEMFVETRTLNVWPNYAHLTDSIKQVQKRYMKGIMEMSVNKQLFPDANLTLRVAYGKVEGFQPKDGVRYRHYTTLEGIMQKDNPEIYDYDVPDRLKEIYNNKDYGRYADDNGQIRVCFSASNHTTGGNSGSPVINAEGQLIGVNFDRCWEGTMSDIMFDPDRCRNIVLDIRYALFIIDKFAGAGYLLDEMEIVD